MRTSIVAKKFNILRGNEAGVGLIETLIALTILGLISAAFLSGLFTASKATFIADERATAESLARSQMEYVKSQDYIDYSDPEHGSYELITTPPNSNYRVEITAERIDPDTGQAQGIQKITVTIEHDDEPVLAVEGYKVER